MKYKAFIEHFVISLSKQVELGRRATDSDYLEFQRTVNANVKTGALTRHRILVRKLLAFDPSFFDLLGEGALSESGLAQRSAEIGNAVAALVGDVNAAYSATHGHDLFKITNKTSQAITRLGRQVNSHERYSEFIDDLYFLLHEGRGNRLQSPPQSFIDVNSLRTELRHDIDHGDQKKVRAKRRKISDTFQKYGGNPSSITIDPERFTLVQGNILAAIETDLQGLLKGSS